MRTARTRTRTRQPTRQRVPQYGTARSFVQREGPGRSSTTCLHRSTQHTLVLCATPTITVPPTISKKAEAFEKQPNRYDYRTPLLWSPPCILKAIASQIFYCQNLYETCTEPVAPFHVEVSLLCRSFVGVVPVFFLDDYTHTGTSQSRVCPLLHRAD